MDQRACVKCNTRWTINASTCPFCGGESKPVNVPPPAWEQAVRAASAPVAAPRAAVTAEPVEAAAPAAPAPGRWARFRDWVGGRRGTGRNRRA
ncbi:MAG TPA: hypothetical protein VEJ18_20910 [Planctomycetota bacterium]|nr:hypothetical protein [Planctomycetota bacterium]